MSNFDEFRPEDLVTLLEPIVHLNRDSEQHKRLVQRLFAISVKKGLGHMWLACLAKEPGIVEKNWRQVQRDID